MRARVRRSLFVAVPLLACAALASPVPVHPSSPAALDRPARPAPEDALELLASLPWPVALPFELPAGYEASAIHVAWSPGDGRGHRIRYSAPGGTCFTIEAALGGFGGRVPERSRPIDPVAFRNGPGAELGDRRGGESPEEMAIRVLERMGFPARREPPGELGVEQVVETTLGEDGRVRVLVTRTGGGDDSVAARRYLVVLIPEGDGGWRFLMGRQFSCHEGRGHTGWSKELCL